MNAVGIDVSKGKSTVAIMRPFGEVIAEPFEVSHTDTELRKLACFLEKLPGETRIVMEYTGATGSLSPKCCTMPAFLSLP